MRWRSVRSGLLRPHRQDDGRHGDESDREPDGPVPTAPVCADVDRNGQPTSHFSGKIDEVRLSNTVRYTKDRFTPPEQHAADADAVLLLACDRMVGPWAIDRSPQKAHPTRAGQAYCTVSARR